MHSYNWQLIYRVDYFRPFFACLDTNIQSLFLNFTTIYNIIVCNVFYLAAPMILSFLNRQDDKYLVINQIFK